MGSIEPDPQAVQAFLEAEQEAAPIVMINLLRYREAAEYPAEPPAGLDATPCSGREAYQRYGALVGPMIGKAGGRIVYIGKAETTLIAPDAEQWDDAVLVEYPSRKAFVGMVGTPEYESAAQHRKAALADSRLIATTRLAGLD